MKRLLIANRGEIALRLLRACRALGIETVAVYTQVDRDLLHLELADHKVCIGRRSYLDADQIVSAALAWACDAIHPGYGFLAENAAFARQVEASGLTYVGPTADQIALMADKASARRVAEQSGLPVLAGSAVLATENEAAIAAAGLGYPVMLKAGHGGGGRGMSVLNSESALRDAFARLQAEAVSLFHNDALYLERFLAHPRHIEVQVLGDGQGNVVHFNARDCSIQRRHQKLLEEAPPPGIPEDTIDALARRCCEALGAIRYRSLGTLEFLFERDEFYFIEMNTRIQVEHPVTEAVCGLDLVKLQLQLADSGQLPIRQQQISLRGHALECRINAEDEAFRPAPGRVTGLRLPGGPGIRFDSHLYEGYQVPHHYDSLVGKLIAHGSDRQDAIARMRAALAELATGALSTNQALHQAIMDDQRFQSGRYNTGFLGSS